MGGLGTKVLISNTVEASPLSPNKLLHAVLVFLSKDSVLFFYMHENYSKMSPDGIFFNVDHLAKILF